VREQLEASAALADVYGKESAWEFLAQRGSNLEEDLTLLMARASVVLVAGPRTLLQGVACGVRRAVPDPWLRTCSSGAFGFAALMELPYFQQAWGGFTPDGVNTHLISAPQHATRCTLV